ncbi:MAG: hypothetical protein LC808_11890 [Actinobacteria bacterium]|nr:hypothetical protein [Actinomycetota bacterium]
MFPSKEPVLGVVRDFLATVLTDRVPLPLRALAAQRLAAWDPEGARGLLREAAQEADHPLERRVLAMAGVTAGEDRIVTRRILSEFEENQVTREMLADVRYRVRVKPDFDPT